MKRKPVLAFFFLAYLISWSAVLALHLIARNAGLESFADLIRMAETTFTLGTILPGRGSVALVFLLSRIVDFGPSIAGLLTAVLAGEPGEARRLLRRVVDFRTGPRWYAWALLLPLGIIGAAFGLHLAFGESSVSAAAWNGLATVGQFFFWVFLMRTLLGGGLGEELGWRGFALPRLKEKHGLLRASLVIGLVWTFWHFPAHLAGSSPIVNVLAQLLYTVPLSFIFTWLYYRSNENLPVVILLHGALNGFNAFFERSLFPPLAEEDGFVIFFILVVLIAGGIAALKLRKMPA